MHEFNFDIVENVKRDRYGRPIINGVPHTRISTLSHGSGGGLLRWRTRVLMLALSRSPDLIAALAGMTYADGAELDDLAEELMVRARAMDVGDTKVTNATKGTAMHKIIASDLPVFGRLLVPYAVARANFYGLLEQYDISIVDTEIFCVNEEFTCAGTADYLMRIDRSSPLSNELGLQVGDTFIGDLKTGSEHWLEWATQLSLYALSSPESGSWGKTFQPQVGVIAHVDINTGEPYLVGLRLGRHLAGPVWIRHQQGLAGNVKKILTGQYT